MNALGNTEVISAKNIAGEFIVVNKHLMKDLIEQGLW